MTIKTHTVEKKNSKHSQEWSWEETPEVLAALEKLHESSKLAASLEERTKRHLKPQMLRQAKERRRHLINRLQKRPNGRFSSIIGI